MCVCVCVCVRACVCVCVCVCVSQNAYSLRRGLHTGSLYHGTAVRILSKELSPLVWLIARVVARDECVPTTLKAPVHAAGSRQRSPLLSLPVPGEKC